MRKVKIVCTLGPASADPQVIEAMVRAGMDVARLNFSHGDHDGHRRTFHMVREAAAKVGKPVAILGDLCGPKIRLGKVEGGAFELQAGQKTTLVTQPILGTPSRLSHSYLPLAGDVRPGDPILINDGLVRLQVERVDGDDVHCVVVVGGPVGDRKGMNLPGTRTSVPALTEKDKLDLQLAIELGFEYVALSFVRSPDDILLTKSLAQGIPVIAKIEKPEAIENLQEILDVADGVMVARGDLGVEFGHEKVPVLQKRIIASMRPLARPVITATQMLESMTTNSTPTRAEASDVANAVLDGTDAVMLSGETAAGRHPALVVETMARIIDEVESSGFVPPTCVEPVIRDRSFSSTIADAATSAAREFGLKALAVYTESGKSAALMSAQRPQPPIVAFTRHDVVLRRLALFWGVWPCHGEWVQGVHGVVEQAERVLVSMGRAAPGDPIGITFGMRLADEPFQTNMLKLWKVRQQPELPLPRKSAPPPQRGADAP